MVSSSTTPYGGMCSSPITARRKQSLGRVCLSLSRGQPLPFEWLEACDGAQLWAPGLLPLGPRQRGDQGHSPTHSHAELSAAPVRDCSKSAGLKSPGTRMMEGLEGLFTPLALSFSPPVQGHTGFDLCWGLHTIEALWHLAIATIGPRSPRRPLGLKQATRHWHTGSTR